MLRNIKYFFQMLLIFIFALTSIVALFFLIFFILKESFPAIKELGKEPFTNIYWYPTSRKPEFGMLAMIIDSLLLTGFSATFVIPIGYFISFYLHTYSNPKEKKYIKSIIEILSGVPSVIIGMFILIYISPLLLKLEIWSTENFLLASIGLMILSLPYTVSLMTESLDSVDKSLEESSLALGVNKYKTTLKVTTKAAISGILNSIILTINRIIGETMVVLLVAGGAAMIPSSIFDPVKPLTAAIASEMGEVELGSLHYHALFLAGLILLFISMVLTVLSKRFTRRWKR